MIERTLDIVPWAGKHNIHGDIRKMTSNQLHALCTAQYIVLQMYQKRKIKMSTYGNLSLAKYCEFKFAQPSRSQTAWY